MKFHALNPSYVLQKCKNWYNINKETKTRKSIDYSKKHYNLNPVLKRLQSLTKERYEQNPGPQKQKSLSRYYENRDAILRATKDKFLRYQLSDNKIDKLKIALNKENKRRLNKVILVSNVTLKIVSLIFMNQHICVLMILLIAN